MENNFVFNIMQASSPIGIGEYQFTNASNIKQVWDITDIYNVTKIENTESKYIFIQS